MFVLINITVVYFTRAVWLNSVCLLYNATIFALSSARLSTANKISPHLHVKPSAPHLHPGSAPYYATKHLKRLDYDWLGVGTLRV